MKNHTDLLNLIAQVIGAKTYIEIGVFNPDHNFNHIQVEHKIGVDPDPAAKASMTATSDKAFGLFKEIGAKANLFWIDGLHEKEQVKLDIQNAWNCLEVGGVIAIHDSNPHKESITHVPRDSREWCGDVYKTICQLKHSSKFTVDFDYGCCVIRKVVTDPETGIDPLGWDDKEITWDEFTANRKELLNLVSVDDAVQIINAWKNDN